jgi:hypothetical protein
VCEGVSEVWLGRVDSKDLGVPYLRGSMSGKVEVLFVIIYSTFRDNCTLTTRKSLQFTTEFAYSSK